MRRGEQLATLSAQDIQLVGGITQCHQHNDKALLLLHGFSSSPAVFRMLIPHLKHYDVIAPTLPGHGESLVSFSKTKATNWVTFVEEQCKRLCQKYTTVDVLGLSLGGVLATHLSYRFPLNRLVLLAPAFDLQLSIPFMLPMAKWLDYLGFNYLRAKAGNLYQNNHCEIAYRQLPLTTIIEVLTYINQFKFVLPQCSTDVFLGQHDAVVNSDQVASRFSQEKHITIHWLANSAHVLPLDGDIESILDCLTPKHALYLRS